MNVWESLGRAIQAEMVDGSLCLGHKVTLAADPRTAPVWVNTSGRIKGEFEGEGEGEGDESAEEKLLYKIFGAYAPKGPIGPKQVTGFLFDFSYDEEDDTTRLDIEILVVRLPNLISPWRADLTYTSREAALKHLKELTDVWEHKMEQQKKDEADA